MQRFAKPPCGVTCIEGSNPSLSARSPIRSGVPSPRSTTPLRARSTPTEAHFCRLTVLPFHHRDPFDRLLAAQALTEDVSLVSGDIAFDPYGVTRIW